jgi:hypothetical protein
LFRIAHLSYVGFVPLGNLLGNIKEELKIQKLPAKVSVVISIYFRSKSCWARQLLTPPATFAFLAVVLIPPHVVPSHLSPPRNTQRRWTTPLPPLPPFPEKKFWVVCRQRSFHCCESTLLNVRNKALPFLGLHLIISQASTLEKLGLQFLMGRLHPNTMGPRTVEIAMSAADAVGGATIVVAVIVIAIAAVVRWCTPLFNATMS